MQLLNTQKRIMVPAIHSWTQSREECQGEKNVPSTFLGSSEALSSKLTD